MEYLTSWTIGFMLYDDNRQRVIMRVEVSVQSTMPPYVTTI